MRKHWLVALLVLPALVFGLAPANAAGTSIRTTTQYAKLKNYVEELDAKKDQPQTQDEISRYRQVLRVKKTDASAKVRNLYQSGLRQAQKKRDQRKARVQNLKQKKKSQLAQLRRAKASALNAIAADRQAALARINNEYDTKINNAQKKLNKLNRKLNKATNPLKRQTLREEIDAVNKQLTALRQARQDEISSTNTTYNNRRQAANERWNNKIEDADTRLSEQIQELQQSLREQYQTTKNGLQQRRATNFTDVRDLYDRGVSYINEMKQPQS